MKFLKPLLIFLTIFIIGFGSGFLVSGRLTKKSIEAVKERENPSGFKRDLYNYLNPDERQKQIIDSIVADYIPKIKEERTLSRLYQKHLRDSMFTKIQSLLDNKQKGKLKKFEEEKIIKKPQPTVAKQKNDTTKKKSLVTRKERMEDFKNSLTPEQKKELDTIMAETKPLPRNPAMNKELRQYARSNIMPVLIKYRSEFEAELSEEEKQTIADLRQKRNALIKAELFGIDDEESMEKQKALIAEAKIVLKEIILKHRVSLEQMAETLKPEREKWEADMDVIKAKYIEGYKPGQSKNFRSKEKNAIDFLLMKGDRKPKRGRR
ncbi:MAG: Spy/CpxP family protein refolding chaperone [Bacteroidia bacterium]